jgi:hypothetical protein
VTRKNYLFVHDDAGASIAGLYSLVATCEARGINPFEYLADVPRGDSRVVHAAGSFVPTVRPRPT